MKKVLTLILGAVVFSILVYFLFFYTASVAKPTANSVEITYNQCDGCSYNSVSIIKSLFSSDKINILVRNVSLSTKLGLSFVSNFSVTSLPTLILNETNISTNILDSLVYLNAFNVEDTYFVLNTPFLAGISKGVKYFDLIQNRTITSFDIFNQSYIYQNTNSSVINPSEILYLVNGTNYTEGNKIEISFVYSNSSFSAIQSLILYKALSSFGNFSNLSTITSPQISLSAGENLGGTQFYTLSGSNYNSSYFYLESSYLDNLSTSKNIDTLEKQLFEFDQNSAYPLFSNLGNFMPFVDIGGRYVEVSSMINPRIFTGMDINQINKAINTNKTDGAAFNDSVYFVETLLCSYIGYTNNVCSSKTIKNDLININSLT